LKKTGLLELVDEVVDEVEEMLRKGAEEVP
jgi:hypothetical protein